jgi:hypothetical protein
LIFVLKKGNVMFLIKKLVAISVFSVLMFVKMYANDDKPMSAVEHVDEVIEQIHNSKWQKYAFYLFGALNGFYLPLSYALALGTDAFDISNPVFKEKFGPFVKGATLGIGCWFAYKVVEWYLQMAVLKALNATLQNPIISRMVIQNGASLQQNAAAS